MKPTFNDKLIAYLALISGLAISGVAEYYSIMGLIAIYPAAFWPIVIMGIVLGMGKITATVWLKQNWEFAPVFLKVYILPAIIVLMIITSLGVFGFLSKAHSDQNLVSGDVLAKIAIYDEKIKTAKENIEANRRQLKQMDEAVDQVMARSTDEKGADKSNAIRRSQQRDRVALAKDIEANQRLIATLNDEAAPIRAEVRKVEAEVGPIKYIAHLLYGENPDANILEKAVIWVTVLIVIVLDPLAVIMLLASQYTFQRFRQAEQEEEHPPYYVADVGEKPTAEEKEIPDDGFKFLAEYDELEKAEGDNPDIVSTSTVTSTTIVDNTILDDTLRDIDAWNRMIAEAEKEALKDALVTNTATIDYQVLEDVDEEPEVVITHTPDAIIIEDTTTTEISVINDPLSLDERPGDYLPESTSYVQNEEQQEESTKWKEISSITEVEYQKTARKHMISDFAQRIVQGSHSIDNYPEDMKEELRAEVQRLTDEKKQQHQATVESLARQVRGGLLKIEQIPGNLTEEVKAIL